MSWFTGPAAQFVRQTQERSVHGVWGRHRLSPPVVRVAGDRAWAELPLGIEFDIEVGGVAGDLVSFCRSQYRAQRTDDAWRIVRITSIYERDTLTASVPGTQLRVEAEALGGLRASYRCLAWYFAPQGAPLRDDLLGDDRPEPVARQYAAERAWLEGR